MLPLLSHAESVQTLAPPQLRGFRRLCSYCELGNNCEPSKFAVERNIELQFLKLYQQEDICTYESKMYSTSIFAIALRLLILQKFNIIHLC